MTTLDQVRRRTAGLVRGAVRRAGRTKVAQRLRRPEVTVVAPFYNVEKYLADCLDSLLAQSFEDFEVLLVDDGSPDGSRVIAETYAARDPRVRIVTRENGGLGAARNTGVREARGRFLTFVDSDDLLPSGALEALVSSARRSGSDIVMGSVERFDSTGAWLPLWVGEVHTNRRAAVHLEDFLPLLRNHYTWNKLYRRDFWDAQGLWFREGVTYEDQPIVTQLLVRARTIDVIPEVVYHYRARDDQSSISQQTATLKDLRDRVEAWRVTLDALTEVPDTVRQAWLLTLFNAHFTWYLTSAGTVEDAYWNEIQAAVEDLTDQASPAVWDATPPENRVLLELTRQGRRADLQEYVRQGGVRSMSSFPSHVREDGIVLALPLHADADLPEHLFLIRPEQMRLSHAIERLEWNDSALHVSGWAFLRKLDLATHDSHVDVLLRAEGSGREQIFPAADRVGAASPPPLSDDWCDYSPGTFEASLPLAGLTAHADEDTWSVHLRVSAAGFVVTQQVTRLLRSGSPGAVEAGWLPDSSRIFVDWRFRWPLRLRRVAGGVHATDLSLAGRTLAGRLVGPDASRVRTLELVAPGVGKGVAVRDAGAGDRPFEVTLPGARMLTDRAPVVWGVRAELVDGTVVQVDHPAVGREEHGSLVLGRDRVGGLAVTEWLRGVEADSVVLLPDGGLRIEGRVFGEDVTSVCLTSRSPRSRDVGDVTLVRDGRFRAELSLSHEAFRFGRVPLPVGEHQVTAVLGRGPAGPSVEVPVRISAELNRLLPIAVETPVHEGRVTRGPTGGIQVILQRPLGDSRSNYAQNRLRQAALSSRGRATTRGLLLRAYFGERATDNGVAIQEELSRRGSDLPVYWAVQDYSVVVPEGGIPVVVNSREWYRLLSSATYYMDNMYQPEYHLKPDGQVMVQTFHGYPFKQMGRPHWHLQQFSEVMIRSYDRRAAEWDYLVSPATYATPLLTRDFGYSGEVLEIGYPRNDVLVSAGADSIRDATRKSLGIRDDQTVVLYAPTFRDYLAKDADRAAMSDFFDFAEMERAFEDDVVVLMRGHAFHARIKQRLGSARSLIDVTDYPEVSDLYLAADVGVVDYSSLRFDFAVTGKPMIFLVPDLARYVETRGWLFDFEPTAPGPLVTTTAEVIEQLRDLDGLRARHRAAYDTFRASYLDLEDGHAAARFVDAVFVPRGDA